MNVENIFEEYEYSNGIKCALPSLEFTRRKGWVCRVYFEYVDIVECSFIADAINRFDNDIVIEFAIKGINNFFTKERSQVKIDFHYIHDFPFHEIDFDIYDSGITNNSQDYLYFKDKERHIFMLLGSEEFIRISMPVSQEVYEAYFKSYYGNWASDNIDALLDFIWENYPRA